MALRIETCNRLQLSVVFGVFFMACLISFLIGMLPPPMMDIQMVSAYNCSVATAATTICPGGVDIASSPYPAWIGHIDSLTPDNLNVGLIAIIVNKRPALGVTAMVNFTLNLTQVSPQQKDVSFGGTHARRVICPQNQPYCRSVVIFQTGRVASYMSVSVRVAETPNAGHLADWMGDIHFMWYYGTAAFTQYQLGYRYALLVVSLIALVAFLVSFRVVPVKRHADQWWNVALLVSVILLDDPAFAFALLTPHWFWTLVDSLCQVVCLSMFMLHVLCIFGGFITEKRTFWGFYVPRVALCLAFAGVACAQLCIIVQRDPTVSWEDNDIVRYLQPILIVLVVLWALVYLYTDVRMFITCRKNSRFVKGRYMMLFWFIHLCLLIYVAGFVLLFFLPDQQSAIVLTLMTIPNAYCWCMSLFLAPSRDPVQTSTTLKSALHPKAMPAGVREAVDAPSLDGQALSEEVDELRPPRMVVGSSDAAIAGTAPGVISTGDVQVTVGPGAAPAAGTAAGAQEEL